MEKKRIYILLGHPDKETTCGLFVDAYEKGARDAGHEVRRTNIGEMKFDPILHEGYKTIQSLEPDLLKVQEDIKWANHFVLVYPNWWSAMPALLKGMFDRMWLPAFAYRFDHAHPGWHKLLKGRSARVIITMDNWPLIARILFGNYTNEIKWAILWFSGFSPIRVKTIGPMKHFSPEKKESWRQTIMEWGRRGK